MSKRAALDFAAKASKDPALREEVRAKGASYSDERLNQAVAVGGSEGFHFTVEELRSALADAKPSKDEELNEEDLEGVVGGAAWYLEAYGAIIDLMNGDGYEPNITNAVAGVRG
jgi:predicted ribosomally synthesized peptide with nif11-like leader